MARRELHSFLLGILFWLPLAYFLWHNLAGVLHWPLGELLEWVFHWIAPGAVQGVQLTEGGLEISTHLPEAPPGVPSGDLMFSIDPRKYSYSIPMLIALLAATPTDDDRWLWPKILGGTLVLMLSVTWSLGFETAKILMFDLGRVLGPADRLPLTGNLVALGFQTGYLILPPVLPIALWTLMSRSFLQQLAPQLFSTAQEN